jgi:hypothetical protein
MMFRTSSVIDNKVNRADGRTEYVGQSSGGTLKVILDERENPAILVTAFWQEGANT